MQATLKLTHQKHGAYTWEQHRDSWTAQAAKFVQKKELSDHVAHIHTQLQATYGVDEVVEQEVILDSYKSTIVAKQSMTEEVVVEETQVEEKQEEVVQEH